MLLSQVPLAPENEPLPAAVGTPQAQEASNSRSPEPEGEAEVSFSPKPADASPSVPELADNDAIVSAVEKGESFSNSVGTYAEEPLFADPQGQDPKPAPELQGQPPPVEKSSDFPPALPDPAEQAQPPQVEKSSDLSFQSKQLHPKTEPKSEQKFAARVQAGILSIKRELEATEHPGPAGSETSQPEKRTKTEHQQGRKVKKEHTDPPPEKGIFLFRSGIF